MHYYGGKSRSGKDIAEILKLIIQNSDSIKGYIEPFCGALGVMRHMTDDYYKCYAFDGCEDLIMLWKELQKDKFKKPNINEKKWLELKKSDKPSALRGYAGFGLSYSGQWFRAYSQKYIGHARDQNTESYNGLIKISTKNVKFAHKDYKNHLKDIENGGYLIYCDPPYSDSLNEHIGSSAKFNEVEFWDTVRKWKKWGNIVVVSERTAPKDFKCIWRRQLSNINKTTYIDKLFI